MKFEELNTALRAAWKERSSAEPSAQWRAGLLRKLKEEARPSLFNLFAEMYPRILIPAASCAVLIAGLAQFAPRPDSDEELFAQFFNGDLAEQSNDELGIL